MNIHFLTGSQHLYGPDTLRRVAENARRVVEGLRESAHVPVEVVWQPVLTTPTEIYAAIRRAETDEACIGIICWMHTFSPGKMWIRGLQILSKPLLHLHTQFYRSLPYGELDMDFMNLHQSAHGGREFGHICARLGVRRKVVAGHWADEEIQQRVGAWARTALGVAELHDLRVGRLGDNMRQVAVTEGDKVAAQAQLGVSVNGYGMGQLVEWIDAVRDNDLTTLIDQYQYEYRVDERLAPDGTHYTHLREAARIELGLRDFLRNENLLAFTDTFENLTGLHQLPGLAVQRLMAEGYGFGAEGDWKTAALLRCLKTMSLGLPGGNSFMEDYTYHFGPGQPAVLGAHMLEICPSISTEQPFCTVHPLGIGGKADPVRLVFNGAPGPALNVSLVDMGDRLRLLVNPVLGIAPAADLPRLPVARVLWQPAPDLVTAAEAWIYAGGAHHTVYSQNVTVDQLRDLAHFTGMELVVIDAGAVADDFR